MKNFRKVLALILVVATLFSFTAMASAAEYTDTDKITADYSEAVDVLSAIGILNGYTDGSFKPTQNIEREEMAKMVAVLSNAGDDVSELYASACTFADAKNSWAASYIAYCNQTGIIAGRSASTFDPDANVTGIETAKMLLCVLGFDAAEQGYVGANWKVNILRDAENIGLLDGFAADFDVSKAITREEAAQMFLNALKSHLVVGTLSNNVVKLSNAMLISKHGNLKDITLIDAEKYGWYNVYGNVVLAKDILASIYKDLTVTAAHDCQGRPGYVWKYVDVRGKVVLNKFYADATDNVYSAWTDVKAVYKNLVNQGYKYEVYVDGDPVVTKTALNDKDLLDAVTARTGNGVRVETYVDEYNEVLSIVVINPYWGYVTATSELYDTFTVNGETYDRQGQDINAWDVVLYHKCNGGLNHAYNNNDLHDVTVVDPVVADLEYTRDYGNINASYFTAEETYNYNCKFKQYGADLLGNEWLFCTLGIYLDEYGYAFLVEDFSDPGYGYAYVIENTIVEETTKMLLNGTFVEVPSYTGSVVYYSAEAGALEVAKDVALDASIVTLMEGRGSYVVGSSTCGALVKYYVNAYGEMVLVQDVYDENDGLALSLFAPVGTMVAADKNMLGDNVFANSATKFMIRTTDPYSGAKSYKEIIGYKNLDATYVSKTVNETLTTIQYTDENRDGIAEYVFIDASYAKVGATFMILDWKYNANAVTLWAYPDYQGFRALVDGVEALVLFPNGVVSANGAVRPNVLYKNAYLLIDAETPYDDNLPVYVYADAYEVKPVSTQKLRLNWSKDPVDGTTTIMINLTGTDGKWNWKICAPGVTIYYVDTAVGNAAYDDYVGTRGYVKLTETLYSELVAGYDYMEGYVLTDADGNVTTVYLVAPVVEETVEEPEA